MHIKCSHVTNFRFDFKTHFGFVSNFNNDYNQINHLKVGGRTWSVAMQVSMIKIKTYRNPVEHIFFTVFAFKYLTLDINVQCIWNVHTLQIADFIFKLNLGLFHISIMTKIIRQTLLKLVAENDPLQCKLAWWR